MSWWIVAPAVGVACLIVLAAATAKRVKTVGPDELPIIQGIIFLLVHRHRLLEALVEWTNKFQCTWTIKWPFSPRYFFITDPVNLEYVLKGKFTNFVKGAYFHNNLASLLGDGIFNSDGDVWHTQRKLAAHMFSRREFEENILRALLAHGAELEAILAAHADSGAPLDLQALFFRFTLDTIGDVAFGHTVGALADPAVPFAAAFDGAQSIVERRFFAPGWQLLERLDGTRARLLKQVRVLDEYSLALIRARRAAGDYARRRDLLSRFMCVTADASSAEPVPEAEDSAVSDEDEGEGDAAPSGTDQGARYPYLHNDAYLRDVVMNFMIAGRDTTAQALAWAVWELSRAPAAEAALAAEAQAVLGRVPLPAAAKKPAAAGDASAPPAAPAAAPAVTYETVSRNLRFTRACVEETLRLHPSVPKDVKQAVADDTLPDGTFIPAGALVAYLPHTMGRLASNWGDSPEAFDPARFLGVKHSPFKAIAFNAGPRTCLGQHMALAEASLVLGLLYRNYTVRVLPGQEITYAESLTLPMKHGIRATLHRRGPAQ